MNNVKESLQESATSDMIDEIFKSMMANYLNIAKTGVSERRAKLKKLHDSVIQFRQPLRDAMYKDFSKHPTEVDLTEIFPVISGIKHIRQNLARWMAPHPVGQSLLLFGSRSWVQYQAKGVVLIISPWNFPVTLTLAPLAAAVAAGNCVMLKPSENTPHTSAVMKKLVNSVFPENEVRLIEGEIETAKTLLKKPFHHIFFTGSPAVGKKIMAAAAKNLSSVTLELGGKSPTIIDSTANLKKAARRIAWGKFMNNGQICLAPDYILVENSVKDKLVALIINQVRNMYGDSPRDSESYCRIVNEDHAQRIRDYLSEDDRLLQAGKMGSNEDDYIPPTLLLDPAPNHPAMSEEIFGPILPVIGFDDLKEVTRLINSMERPLGMYIYSRQQSFIRHIIRETRSGSVVINHNVVHFSNEHLPFGGENNSGIGRSGGFYSFRAFSAERAFMKQWSPISAIRLVMPPYTKFKQRLADLMLRWF